MVWEKLTADTQVAATQTDTDPNSAKKNSSGRLSPSEVARRTEYERRRLRWVLGIASAVALLLILLAVGWTFHDDSTPRPVGEDVTPTRLVVGGSDSEKGLGSVEEALKRVARFRAGRSRHPITIVIAGDIEEQLDFDFKDLGLRDLSIEPEEGREVVWRYPSKKSGTYHAHQLLFLNNAAGVTVRGLTFDGGNQVNQILLLAGECAGFRLENVSLRGFQQRAILVTNCTGRDDRKVVLSGIRTETQTPKEAAITFDLWDHLLPKRTQYITVEDCQFQGPYKSPIQVASKPDIKDLDLPADLVRSTPPPAKQSVHK